MSFFKLLSLSLIHPTSTIKAIKMKFGTTLCFILLLNIILMIPSIIQSFNIRDAFINDLHNAQKYLPNFQIKNNKMHTKNNEGVIYEGKLAAFTYDPQDKRSGSQLSDNLDNQLFGLALNSNTITIGLNSNLLNSVPMKNPIRLDYSTITNTTMTKTQFFNELQQTLKSSTFVSMFLLFLFSYSLGILITNLLIVTFSAWLYVKLSKIKLKITQVFKLCLPLSVIPMLLQIVLSLFFSISSLSTITLIITLTLFFITVRNLRNNTY